MILSAKDRRNELHCIFMIRERTVVRPFLFDFYPTLMMMMNDNHLMIILSSFFHVFTSYAMLSLYTLLSFYFKYLLRLTYTFVKLPCEIGRCVAPYPRAT
jgi:hypothetical protein